MDIDYVKIEKRILSMVSRSFRVCVHLDEGLKWWYICSGIGEMAIFLWDDGTINGTTGYAEVQSLRETPGFWRTKEDAEEYLDEWQNAAAEYEDQEAVAQEPVPEAEGDRVQ